MQLFAKVKGKGKEEAVADIIVTGVTAAADGVKCEKCGKGPSGGAAVMVGKAPSIFLCAPCYVELTEKTVRQFQRMKKEGKFSSTTALAK